MMPKAEVTVTGLAEVHKKLSSIYNKIYWGSKAGMKDSLEYMQKEATQNLRDSSKGAGRFPNEAIENNWDILDVVSKGGVLTQDLINTSPHAIFVEYGTAGKGEFSTTDMIRPTGDGPMIFHYYGRWIRKHEVQGQSPKAYLRNAAASSPPKILSSIAEEISTRLQGI
jgi:hypothetical protein